MVLRQFCTSMMALLEHLHCQEWSETVRGDLGKTGLTINVSKSCFIPAQSCKWLDLTMALRLVESLLGRTGSNCWCAVSTRFCRLLHLYKLGRWQVCFNR